MRISDGSSDVCSSDLEMRRCGSLIMQAADSSKLPAGGALAVDREGFSGAVEAALTGNPHVKVAREEVSGLPPAEWDQVIVATGPLQIGQAQGRERWG